MQKINLINSTAYLLDLMNIYNGDDGGGGDNSFNGDAGFFIDRGFAINESNLDNGNLNYSAIDNSSKLNNN